MYTDNLFLIYERFYRNNKLVFLSEDLQKLVDYYYVKNKRLEKNSSLYIFLSHLTKYGIGNIDPENYDDYYKTKALIDYYDHNYYNLGYDLMNYKKYNVLKYLNSKNSHIILPSFYEGMIDCLIDKEVLEEDLTELFKDSFIRSSYIIKKVEICCQNDDYYGILHTMNNNYTFLQHADYYHLLRNKSISPDLRALLNSYYSMYRLNKNLESENDSDHSMDYSDED